MGNEHESLAQQIAALREQVSILVEYVKSKEPTEREILTAQLEEAREKKDFNRVVELSNQLSRLSE